MRAGLMDLYREAEAEARRVAITVTRNPVCCGRQGTLSVVQDAPYDIEGEVHAVAVWRCAVCRRLLGHGDGCARA